MIGRSKGMRRTIPAAILLVGLGTAGVGMVHCGETTSSVGAMNDVVNQACSPVGSMAKASDGCNACTCSQSGQWACTTLACAAPDGGGDSTVGPGGVSCVYNGISYRPGDTFASTDGCNDCTCAQSGQVACTLIACAQARTRLRPTLRPTAGASARHPPTGATRVFAMPATGSAGCSNAHPPGTLREATGSP